MLRVVVAEKGKTGSPLKDLTWESRALLIGRDPTADLVVNHPEVSRRHLRLTMEGEGVRVEDLNSANGTWHGEERISSLLLNPPFTVRLGSEILVTLLPPEVAIPRKRRTLLYLLLSGIAGMILLLLFLPQPHEPQTKGRSRTGVMVTLTPLPELPPERLFLWAKLKENDAHFIPGSLGLAVRAYAQIATTSSPLSSTAETLIKPLKSSLEERLKRLEFEALRAWRAREIHRARQVLTHLKLEAKSYDLKYYEKAISLERELDRWEGKGGE